MTELASLVAAAHAGPSLAPAAEATRPHVAVRTNSRWFAIAAPDVVEAIALPPITRVPAAPSHLLGVAMIRTRLVTLVDLEQLVAARPTPQLERGRVVVIRADDVEVGVVAMATRGLLRLPDGAVDEVAPPERPVWIAREVALDDVRFAVIDVGALIHRVLRGQRS